TAERAMLATLEAGCRAPVAGLATVEPDGKRLRLRGAVIRPDGGMVIKRSRTAELSVGDAAEDAARQLGTDLAGELLAAGGGDILKDSKAEVPGGPGGGSHAPPGAGRV